MYQRQTSFALQHFVVFHRSVVAFPHTVALAELEFDLCGVVRLHKSCSKNIGCSHV